GGSHLFNQRVNNSDECLIHFLVRLLEVLVTDCRQVLEVILKAFKCQERFSTQMRDDVFGVILGPMDEVETTRIKSEMFVHPVSGIAAADQAYEEHPQQGEYLGVHDRTIIHFWFELNAGIKGSAVDHPLDFILADHFNRLPALIRGDVL